MSSSQPEPKKVTIPDLHTNIYTIPEKDDTDKYDYTYEDRYSYEYHEVPPEDQDDYIQYPDVINTRKLPPSYHNNTKKEKLCLEYAKNFRLQYVHLYNDRQPLMLFPVNECGVEKVICTTCRPTLLPQKQFFHWKGCADFVADYVSLEQLPCAYRVPEKLFSPTTVIMRQKGTCFDVSNLLCSMLIGAGYDAYVVSGYATKEVCLADESRQICPLLIPPEKVEEVVNEKPNKKYTVRLPRGLVSRYEKRMQEAELEKQRKEEEKQRAAILEAIEEREKPPPDPLFGLRVHSWVLVKAGKREVPEDFFVEPFTGRDHSPKSTSFLGIESVWNSANYWVNMQDCSDGCARLSFDLYNTVCWELLMEDNFKANFKGLHGGDEEDFDDFDEENAEDSEGKQLDVPASWCKPIVITQKQIVSQIPTGKKTILFKHAVMEKYAEYLLPDGMVSRLFVYDDMNHTNLLRTEDRFANRADKCEMIVDDQKFISEHFTEGKTMGLKLHRFRKNDTNPFVERVMRFFHEIRTDGLEMRSDCMSEMVESFVDRSDRLYYRRVIFGKPESKSDNENWKLVRPILKITEKFHRNPDVDANEDVDTRMFVVADDKITVSFHRNDECITNSTRTYYKPPNAEEKGGNLPWNKDMTSAYMVVHPSSKKLPTKQVPVYQYLLQLIQVEQKAIKGVRVAEDEIKEILKERDEQKKENELIVSVYDTERNEKAKAHREELERLVAEEAAANEDKEMDYLAPFLQQINNPRVLTPQQAFKLKEECLADLKQRLIDKANLIQQRFEKETAELHKRQQEYQQKQVAMTKDDEEEYFNYCSEAMFRIHILEMRLNRHKQIAPNKYMQMEQKLRSDPRLSKLL